MKLLNIISVSLFQILSLIFVLCYLLGVLNIHFSDRKDYCDMTYMFEYPQFVRITIPENKDYPQYGLYAYSEGRFTERTRKMWFDGVPVLYLPGTSGSHMQARSLASVALRKALKKGYEYHFDYFTISYNEELSGLYGGVLESQTKYAVACISRILGLYKSNKYTKSVPTSVIVIGHSLGGVIAKRLLTYPDTINTTNIAITLAAPVQAPVIHFDMYMINYYTQMQNEWQRFIDNTREDTKLLLSFGNGPRDILVPPGLTSSNESSIGALTTAIPGVWVSADHVSIVWCKQIVMAINKFLFSILDAETEQIVDDKQFLMKAAKRFFQANRSMTLSTDIHRADLTMIIDAFWYEDNRRIYQISRPEIDRTTYLMIRLVGFPQNRFSAIEAVNVDDRDWVFGCNAKFAYNSYRYCKQATSLTELSRWTGAANNFGKRKLATVHLHSLKEQNPDWTHVIIKVSPTRKPIILNVDINDLASRQITVDLPSDFSFGKQIIKQETEPNSLYYELILPDFYVIHQAYLLYIEPTAGCKASQYHVSAEIHVPWANNHESYHYFTESKRSPMKLRLFKSNPNITLGAKSEEHVKITVLLDPQCTYTISISTSWYLRLAQFARNYTAVLTSYVAAIILLAASASVANLHRNGTFPSIHSALMSERVKPWYSLICARLVPIILMYIPFSLHPHGWDLELKYFTNSLLVLPAYMTALGILHIGAAAVLAVMVFSSQLAHRLLFRIVWRGGSGLAERVAAGLQRVPLFVSAALVCGVPLACGAASLAAGAAFYAFMLSKKYEEYLEDYVYKLMAKVASRICRMFKTKHKASNDDKPETRSILNTTSTEEMKSQDFKAVENTKPSKEIEFNQPEEIANKQNTFKELEKTDNEKNALVPAEESSDNKTVQLVEEEENFEEKCKKNGKKRKRNQYDTDIDEELNSLNFHMMMFFMWVVVTIFNIPVLLTWARNFKYNRVLRPDASFLTGLVMSLCSSCLWQMEVPRSKLLYYIPVSDFLFMMAVLIMALGPQCLVLANNFVMFMFVVMTLQQLLDRETTGAEFVSDTEIDNKPEEQQNIRDNNLETTSEKATSAETTGDTEETKENETQAAENQNDCDVCNEGTIYNIFKNLRDKFSLNEELS